MRTNNKKTRHAITKKVMEQYETVRISQICNMFDYFSVMNAAYQLGLQDLSCLSQKEYVLILQNFAKYMALYNIEQQ